MVHIITGLNSGGAERMLTRIVTADIGQKQTVISLMNEGVYGAEIKAAGIAVHCLKLDMKLPNPLILLRLAYLLKKLRPDVVMTWLYHADLLGLVAAKLAGINKDKIIWNIRCSDMDLSHRGLITQWILKALIKLSATPRAVATNSLAGQKHHKKLGYNPKRWIYLPNGVDTNAWSPNADRRIAVRTELGVDDNQILIGLVARVDPVKNHDGFLKAAVQVSARYPDARFLLVGDGVFNLTIPPELENCLYRYSYRVDIPDIMRALDLHVLCSHSEGFPNVLCEAMACGTPCLVTDAGDAAEIIGKTGIIVPVADTEALAAGILSYLSETTEQRSERGAAARARALDHYTIERVYQAYRECLSVKIPTSA